MYWKQLGFQRSPFSVGAEAGRFFESTSQQEGLARLDFLVRECRRGGLVVGVPGAGKTALVREFSRRAARAGREIVVVDCPAFGSRELFYDIAHALGLNPGSGDSEAELWRRVRQQIREARSRGEQVVIVVDQAELLLGGNDGVHALNALFHLDPDPSANYAVILAARPEAVARFRKELVECMDLSVIVEPFSEEETQRYVEHVCRWAGADRNIFDEEALRTVYRLSDGVPRRIDRVCDLALVAAAAERAERVTDTIVRSIAGELDYGLGRRGDQEAQAHREREILHRQRGEAAWEPSRSES